MKKISNNKVPFSPHIGSYHGLFICCLIAAIMLLGSCKPKLSSKNDVLNYLKSMGNGSYLFGQVATWVHNENPDMDHPSNWLKKVYDHSGKMPRYGVITYDFTDDPFPDSAWNRGVKKIWDRGLIAGVYTFWANPTGNAFRDSCDVDQIFAPESNSIKTNFYAHGS